MRLSLRLRFFAAIGLVALLVIGAFWFALNEFVEVLEDELLNRSLARELQEFGDAYARDPAMALPASAGLRAFVQRDDRPAALPGELAALAPGLHEVQFEGEERLAGRKDVGGARLYMVMDIGTVEALEEQLVGLALLCGVAALLLSAFAAAVLSRMAIRPVSRLAQRVASLAPQRRGERLAFDYGDREIGEIAAGMDRYLERIDQYIEREQAFTEDASHELRTPLATVISAAQLLVEQPGMTAQMRERLSRILRAGAQMQGLIEALLFLAREDGGGPAQDCALDGIVRDAVETARAQGRDRGVAIELAAQPVRCRVVPGMAASVINNLLLNAMRHGGGGRVDVTLAPDRLVVQDHGAGIAAEELPQIFDRHYRGAGSGGLGVGLSIVRRICDRLGWTVEVDSARGQGARFTILLGLTKN
jgi:signal transduction histidine kinase